MAQDVMAQHRSDELTDTLRSALREGHGNLALVPPMVVELIDRTLWRERPTSRGRVNGRESPRITFRSWEAYVRAKPPAGLGEDPARVRAVCRGTPAEAPLAKVEGPGQGRRTDLPDNVREVKRQYGNSRNAAYQRLEHIRPDLYQRVLARELTPHRAMLEAGLRHPTATIQTDDISRAIRVLLKHFTPAQIRAALERME